jgi:hypothetical protein
MTDGNGKKKFNLSVTPLKRSANGNLTWIVNEEALEKLQEIEVGGRFMIKMVPEDRKKHERSPDAYFEYISVDDVRRFREANKTENDSL